LQIKRPLGLEGCNLLQGKRSKSALYLLGYIQLYLQVAQLDWQIWEFVGAERGICKGKGGSAKGCWQVRTNKDKPL
jgi:hypothetical protein